MAWATSGAVTSWVSAIFNRKGNFIVMVSVQKKIQAGFGVALVFLLFTGATAWWRAQQNAEAFRAVEHSHRVLDSFEAILVQMLDTETRCRGFALSGDETYLQSYEAGLAAVQTSFNAAKQLTGDNPGQQLQLADIERLIQQKINGENTLIRLRRSGDRAGMAQYISSGRAR